MKKFRYVLLFSIVVSCYILNTAADDINKKIPDSELKIQSGDYDVTYFKSDGKLLNII